MSQAVFSISARAFSVAAELVAAASIVIGGAILTAFASTF
jgi:hypothetical protein